MTSASVLHFPNSTSVLIPEKPASEITQLELVALLSLKSKAYQLDKQITEAERSIRDRLQAGACIESGDRIAELKETSRRNVSWREVTERLADRLFGPGKGDSYCERVLRSTKPTPSVSLVVR
jgi:hypothetical protein